ncbi:unnamed protein product [Dicrocoelium dendriticum]|nr:unnamed protein product [Dicrocoelium dendriticum]
MLMPELDDQQTTETVLQSLIMVQNLLEFEGSSCTPFTLPVYHPILHTWDFEIPLNKNSAAILTCDTIRDRSTCPLYSCELKISQSEQILLLQFPAELCGQLDDFTDDRQAAFLVHSFLNENTPCLVIQYTETKDAFVKVPHERYFFALVSGPSYVDVCQNVRLRQTTYRIPYGAHICEEIPNEDRSRKQRIFRIRPKELIYFSDIPWYMNEHNKFVFFLNSHGPNCVFNGYVQLNESRQVSELTGQKPTYLCP